MCSTVGYISFCDLYGVDFEENIPLTVEDLSSVDVEIESVRSGFEISLVIDNDGEIVCLYSFMTVDESEDHLIERILRELEF